MSLPAIAGVRHVSREEAEAYVMGLLDETSLASLEEHVVGCLPCGRLLAAEARREVALGAAMACLSDAPAPPARAVVARRMAARLSSAVAPLVVTAAAVLLLAGPPPRLLERSHGQPTASAPGLSSTGSEPLLACLLDGEAALCPLPDRMSNDRRPRAVLSDAMTVQGPALCRATDATCPRRSP